jgi:hypothetical protein
VKPETWAAIAAVAAVVAALIALGALIVSGVSARAALRATRAAEEQTKIQEQLRIDAAQAYVWADVRPDDEIGQHKIGGLPVSNSTASSPDAAVITRQPPGLSMASSSRRFRGW